MKNIVILLFSVCGLLSINSIAEVEEVVVTGVYLGSPAPDPSAGAYAELQSLLNATRYSTTYSPEAFAQMKAAQEAAEKAAREAAKKAERKAKYNTCMQQAKDENNERYALIWQRYTEQTADCHFLFAQVPEALAACKEQAIWHYDGSSQGSDDRHDIDKEWCESQYGE